MQWPPQRWRDVTVLVGVSGGSDSMALARGLSATARGGTIEWVHIHHGLRGTEADEDATFVREQARRLDVPCHLEKVETPSGSTPSEGQLREARYHHFRLACDRVGARYLALAHTADDQAETVLHRLMRGTGVGGLAGIPRTRSLSPLTTVVRPLLALRRTDLCNYLESLDQPWRVDSSNARPDYLRNRIRAELLPLMEALQPQAVASLNRLCLLATECQQVVDQLVSSLAQSAVGRTDRGVEVTVPEGTPAYLVRALLIEVWCRQGWPRQAMGWEQWDRLAEMAAPDTPSPQRTLLLPGGIRAERTGPMLRLQRSD